MQQEVLFTVIMANYNNACYIEEAIKSVINQTYTHWELIIVDDASTDNSWDIILKIAQAEPRIKYYKNNRNRKVGYTKWRCMELAGGQLCGMLDPDDALESNALELMVDLHAKYPNSCLITSNYFLCDQDLRIISKLESNNCVNEKIKYLIAIPGILHHFWSLKKEKYNLTSGFSENFILAEDQDIFYKLEEVGDIYSIDTNLYYYRQHPNNTSKNKNTALAFTYHLDAMFDALQRRKKFLSLLEKNTIITSFENFMKWGIYQIPVNRLIIVFIKYFCLKPIAFAKIVTWKAFTGAFFYHCKTHLNFR